ncbi:NmrA family NAD(P)-binding protein [Prescottella soli]|uniref:NmrA family NAD(P)-binding protein n=1 Tax=Prescottella soli TaxID=1543852 RepID=A0ABW9FWX8_9NOCA
MKVAVTGGTGYLGAHTTRALLVDGHDIRLLVHPDEPASVVPSLFGAAADRIARALQDAGAPVVITYPSSVVGPGLGGMRGVTATGWAPMVAAGVAPRMRGGMQMIDVRDVADALGAVLPVGAGLSYEAAWLLTAATPTDGSRTLSELGLTWRPVRAALSASVRAPVPGAPEGITP